MMTNGNAIPETKAINEYGLNFLIHSRSIKLIFIWRIKFFRFSIPTTVIKKMRDGAMTTDNKAPSILFCQISSKVTESPMIWPMILMIIKNEYFENPFIME